MVEIQVKFMSLVNRKVSHNNLVIIIRLKIQIILIVQIFNYALTALLLLEQSQETKEIVGLSLNIQYGK